MRRGLRTARLDPIDCQYRPDNAPSCGRSIARTCHVSGRLNGSSKGIPANPGPVGARRGADLNGPALAAHKRRRMLKAHSPGGAQQRRGASHFDVSDATIGGAGGVVSRFSERASDVAAARKDGNWNLGSAWRAARRLFPVPGTDRPERVSLPRVSWATSLGVNAGPVWRLPKPLKGGYAWRHIRCNAPRCWADPSGLPHCCEPAPHMRISRNPPPICDPGP